MSPERDVVVGQVMVSDPDVLGPHKLGAALLPNPDAVLTVLSELEKVLTLGSCVYAEGRALQMGYPPCWNSQDKTQWAVLATSHCF